MDIWLKFVPKDWNGDSQLRRCSLAARGFLAALLEPMHKAEPYGHLLIDGNPPTFEDLATIASCKPREADYCLAELLQYGALSRNANGIVFSRRMVRDRERRLEKQRNGAKGGNPRLIATSEVNQTLTGYLSPMASGSLVSSSESSLEGKKEASVDQAWNVVLTRYPQHRVERGRIVQDGFIAACLEVGIEGVFERLEAHKRSAQWKRGLVPKMSRYFGQEQLWRQALPEQDAAKDPQKPQVGRREVQPMGIQKL